MIKNIIDLLSDIQSDCGDNLDCSGRYTSDRIGQVIDNLKKYVTIVPSDQEITQAINSR